MAHPLITTDYSCDEHSDCTVTVYSNDLGLDVRRHLHQWVDPMDKPGATDQRTATDVVVGAINVGILKGYDDETGEADFAPDEVRWTASFHPEEAAYRLNLEYPWADDLRDGTKCAWAMPSDAIARQLGLTGQELVAYKAEVAAKNPAGRQLPKPPKKRTRSHA